MQSPEDEQEIISSLGIHRVIEPQGSLPQPAWKQAGELALTSLGLDGEAVDALTGLAKPRYVPQPGVLVATTVRFVATGRTRRNAS